MTTPEFYIPLATYNFASGELFIFKPIFWLSAGALFFLGCVAGGVAVAWSRGFYEEWEPVCPGCGYVFRHREEIEGNGHCAICNGAEVPNQP